MVRNEVDQAREAAFVIGGTPMAQKCFEVQVPSYFCRVPGS